MYQFDVVAVPASRDYSTFADLKLGRSSQTVVGRILRHWDARNFKRQGEFMGVVFLLFDEQDSVIHGFIPARRAQHYRQALHEGAVVTIQAFEVARAATSYRLTDHPFFLRFLPTTTITEARNVVASIGRESFLLRTNEQLHSQANTNSELPDVVDPKLKREYPPKSVAKLAAVEALCVHYESEFRPNMIIVVKALQPLLKPPAPVPVPEP